MIKILVAILVLTIIVVMLIAEEKTQESNGYKRLSAQDFGKKKTEFKVNGEDYILLDIRTRPEFIQGHITGARMLDFYSPEFKNELNKLDKTKVYLIYCRSGNRTGQALKIMQKMEFEEVYDLQNGIVSWLKAGYTLVTD